VQGGLDVGIVTLVAVFVREFFLFVSYVKNHTFPQPLSAAEEELYMKRYQSGDEEARNVLIEHNLRLVAHLVKKYDHGQVESEDLISIGTIGLIKGIQTYKPDKGVKLATYAARCIENEILMHMRSAKKTRKNVSLHEPIGQDKEGNEVALLDLLGTDGEEVLETVQMQMDRERIYHVLAALNPREREIVWARFGLLSGEEKTQREIAKELGISRSYVSRIEKRALEKLYAELDHSPQ
jgi:RNA polymerase sporulation-specific sigma factor